MDARVSGPGSRPLALDSGESPREQSRAGQTLLPPIYFSSSGLAWPEGSPRLACLSFPSMSSAPASTVCWNGFHKRQIVLPQALSSSDLYSKCVKL